MRVPAGMEEHISTRHFLYGLMGVTVLYAAIAFYILFIANHAPVQDRDIAFTIYRLPPPIDIPEPKDVTPIVVSPADKLEPAPNPDLVETTESGLLPKVSPQGLTPFQAYRKPFLSTGKPILAILISDFGLSDMDSQSALHDLPPQVSLILSPYAEQPQRWADSARADGHEFWLHLPIENLQMSDIDLGAKPLLTDKSLKENQIVLAWVLGRATGYAGVASFTDEIFVKTPVIAQSIFKSIYDRGLGYVEMNAAAPMSLEQIAATRDSIFIKANHLNQPDDEDLEDTLENLVRSAAEKGYAVGIFKPYPRTIAILSQWLAAHEGTDFNIAPLSAIASIQSKAPPR